MMEVASTTLGTIGFILLLQSAVRILSQPPKNGFLRAGDPPSLRQNGEHEQRRLQTRTITTTNCDTRRVDPYPFELKLLYEYSVEAEAGSSVSLDALEQAIVHNIANELNMCDGLGQPLFSVKETTRHSFSKTEFCAPTIDPTNTCQVVIGTTSILVFDDSTFVRMEAARAVKNGLKNGVFFEVFAGFVVQTEYRGPISEILVYSPDNSDPDGDSNVSPVTTTVAVAAASLTFFVASLFCYGMLRKNHRRHPEPRIRHQRNCSRNLVTRTVNSGSRVGGNLNVGARRNFVRLEDLVVSQTPHHTESTDPINREDIPTMTWSVSDITSDSASVVSRSVSMLERIEEENEDEHFDGYYGRSFDVDDDGYEVDSSQSGSSCRSGLTSIREVDEVEEDSKGDSGVVEACTAIFDCVAVETVQSIDVSDLDAGCTMNSRLLDRSRDDSIDGNCEDLTIPQEDPSRAANKVRFGSETGSISRDKSPEGNYLEANQYEEDQTIDEPPEVSASNDEDLNDPKSSLSISIENMKEHFVPAHDTPSTANSSSHLVQIDDECSSESESSGE